MSQLEGVIFDLGSTLIRFQGEWLDVLEDGREAATDYLVSAGYPIRSDTFSRDLHLAFERNFVERRRDHRERASRVIVREVAADHGVTEIAEPDIRETLRRLYAPSEACWSAVPGVAEVLERVARPGRRIGLLSNASDVENVERLMKGAGLDGRFDPIVISAAVGMRKPTPTLFLDIVRGWDVPPEAAVMVGDMLPEDILGAQRAGLHQIWIRGQADPAFNEEYLEVIRPEVTVETLDDVPPAIEALEAGGR